MARGWRRCARCAAEVREGASVCEGCGAALEGGSVLAGLRAWQQRWAVAVAALRVGLAGLERVNVQVEPINADAERDGLERSDLRADVEAGLRRAGIALAGPSELFFELPGTPVLHLDVMTLRLRGSYVYTVRLGLWQAVRLVRDPSVQTLALTWSRPALIGTVPSQQIADVRRSVQAAIDEFAAEVAAAAR